MAQSDMPEFSGPRHDPLAAVPPPVSSQVPPESTDASPPGGADQGPGVDVAQPAPGPANLAHEPQQALPVEHLTPNARRPVRVPPEARGPSEFSRSAFWLMATIAVVLFCWFVGPLVVERYQYAMTRGQVRAEYENAVELLQSQPLTHVSSVYELVAQKIRPSVVTVLVQGTVRDGRFERIENGQGSGVIVSSDGYIVTCHHVIRDAGEITVELYDRQLYRAQVVGSDELTDLAVIKIDARGLVPAEWGDSDKLRPGSMVWAIGSPFTLKNSITAGIISATNRPGEQSPYQELLQSDAWLNFGNSGGPLVDAQSQIVGINTAIFGADFRGISFSIPSSIAQHVYQQILKYGHVRRGFLGVQPRMVDPESAQQMELPDLEGVLLESVERNSPAARAGLRNRDVIRRWNSAPVENIVVFYRYVGMTPPESTAEVELIRDGRTLTMHVQVGERPAEDDLRRIPELPPR